MNNILDKINKYVNSYYISVKYKVSNLTFREKLKGVFNILLVLILIIVFVDFMIFGSSIAKNSPVGIGLGSGSSMEPIIDSGCSIIFIEPYTEDENIGEGDIVSFSTDTMDDYYIHQIIKKYESYDPDTAKHKILNDKYSREHNHFVVDKGMKTDYIYTKQSKERAEELQGETVYIMKGTNNDTVDPVLVSEEDIAVSLYRPYIELSDDNSLCRENPLKNLDELHIKFHY